ncbi:MAG: C4-dicarboxylate ABC transporter permease [Deltaproteobacteria bacterium RBG_13_47_9]|nr:MAG: C4-dicarboxylate ABC transporter permease [Deltaproteobacteria bacterium RBG_13_47_9]
MVFRLNPLSAGFLGIVLLIAILFSGMPIGIVMGLIGFLGMAYVGGTGAAFTSIGSSPYTTVSSYGLSVVPLFILMGSFCFFSGLSRDLYNTAYKWLGHFPGGLAMATVGGCAGFAAVSGSSVATTATMGMVALPEMKRYKYNPLLATGCIAAGGSIGILIPPSIILVIYGILTEQSIGKLFLAGFIPGVLEALFYMVTIYILCRRNPLMGPRGEKSTFEERFVSFKDTWGVLVLFLLVIGGIYLGVFTPTEAAGVGAFGAFLFVVGKIAFGKKRLTWQSFFDSLIDTGKMTAMVFVILIGANILGYFLAITRLPFALSDYVASLEVNRYIVLAIIIVVYLFLGAIMSSMAMIVLTVPILFPVITALGFDPIWFGIIIVRVVEIGQITPPVGINVFIIQGIAKDVPMFDIFRGVFPFLIADILHVVLLIAVPQIALFLPGLMK